MGEAATLLAGVVLGVLVAGVVFVVRDLVRLKAERLQALELALQVAEEGRAASNAAHQALANRVGKLEQLGHALDMDTGALASRAGLKRYGSK